MRLLRLVSQLHENERVVAFAATPSGRLVLWLAATILLLRGPDAALLFSPILALILVLPEKRHAIFAIGSLGAFYKVAIARGLVEPWALLIGLVGVLAYSYACFRIALRFEALPAFFRRFPLPFAHLPMFILVAVLWYQRGSGGPIVLEPMVAAALGLLPFFVWRWSFLLYAGRRGQASGTRFSDHLFYLLPVFGGTDVPYGKGYGYLSSRSAESALDVSRSQLAGLKLLVLGTLWSGIRILLEVVVYGASTRSISALFGGWSLGLTSLGSQLALESPGDVAAPTAWLMVGMALVIQVLRVAAMGHLIIGMLRLCGYNVFRNTYKPLLADSVVAYWNRFYYYFKELLVEFFFYPTFLATARLPMNLRIFASVMAAAFLGNLYFHMLRDVGEYLGGTGAEITTALIPRVVYSFALGLGVFVSMVRERKRRRQRGAARPPLATALVRIRRIAGVWAFYGLLLVWVAGPNSVGFVKRAEFMLALIGVH